MARFYTDRSSAHSIIGMPDHPDCTADDYLDAEDDFAIRSVEDESDVSVTFDERKKVILCGNEYVRSTQKHLDDEGESQIIYNYVRKIDAQLMCIICISGTKPVNEYEALFK